MRENQARGDEHRARTVSGIEGDDGEDKLAETYGQGTHGGVIVTFVPQFDLTGTPKVELRKLEIVHG